MSIGYWLGGKRADKDPNINNLSTTILLGALATSLIPIFEIVLVKNFANISDNLVLIALVTSAIIFGIPSFVMATVSPFAVKLRDKEYSNVGEISGRTSSLSPRWKKFFEYHR